MRRLMISVALAALVIWPVAYLKRRRDRFLQVASYHEKFIKNYRVVPGFRPRYFDPQGVPLGRFGAETVALIDIWHQDLKKKYERAAARPWLSVKHDQEKPVGFLIESLGDDPE